MVDFIKIAIKDNEFATALKNNGLLDFSTQLNDNTGELINGIHKAEYKNLSFTIYPSSRIEIAGSLHKYRNAGEHNYNDFTYTDLLSVLTDLADKFSHLILKAGISNIEYGINIVPPFEVKTYLQRVITLKGNGTSERHPIVKDELKGFKKGYHLRKSQYGLKIYDKGGQYQQEQQIVRHEFKTYKMQAIEGSGICILFDLTDIAKLRRLSVYLFNCYHNTLIKEDLETGLKRHEERIHLECINADNWSSWDKDKRYKRQKQFDQIISHYAVSSIKNEVTRLLTEKNDFLLSQTQESTDVLTALSEKFSRYSGAKSTDVLTGLSGLDSTPTKMQSTDVLTALLNGKNVATPIIRRYCKTCGNDISDQNKKSIYCSAKKVGYLQAHKCRNTASNPKNNLRKKIDNIKSKGVLFEIEPFLKQNFLTNKINH